MTQPSTSHRVGGLTRKVRGGVAQMLWRIENALDGSCRIVMDVGVSRGSYPCMAQGTIPEVMLALATFSDEMERQGPRAQLRTAR